MRAADDKQYQTGKRGLGSIDLAMRLLGILTEADGPMKLKDIAAAADMPPAKVHRYMASFLNGGMVAQNGPAGPYDLGPFAMRLGISAIARNDVVERAANNLASLRNDIRATCFVSCWSDLGPIIVRWEDSRRPITVIVQIGSTMPLLKSATGRVYLAFMRWAKIAPLLARELSESGIKQEEADRLAQDTKTSGFGQVSGTFQPGIAGISVPLFGPVGEMVGAVTAMGRQGEFDISPDGSLVIRLREFAKQISRAG